MMQTSVRLLHVLKTLALCSVAPEYNQSHSESHISVRSIRTCSLSELTDEAEASVVTAQLRCSNLPTAARKTVAARAHRGSAA